MIYITRTQKSLLAVAVFIAIIIGGTIYIKQEKATEINLGEAIELNEPSAAAPQEIKAEAEEISVYICGCVKNPGVVQVREGTRLDEAIEMVGGPGEEADMNVVNLAYKLADEDMIYIPKKGEDLKGTGNTVPGVNTVQNVTVSRSGKVDINTAGQSELEALNGIGPATATKIIEYRKKSGPFKSIEEIKNVTGIGDKKFDGIKDDITVN